VGSGKYSDVFKVQAAKGSKAVIMKVSYYRDETLCNFLKRAKRGDMRGARAAKNEDSVRVSADFAKITAGMLEAVSPHFVYVFCDQDCTSFARRLGPLLKQRLTDLTPTQAKFNNVCFMEVFHDNMTNYLVRGKYDEASLRVMVFQVLYTLAALQKRYPGFRHNDLSTNNVLVKKLRNRPLLSYSVGDRTYYAANNVLPALADYDFVNVPGVLRNQRVHSGNFKVDGRRNDSYDSHFFLKSVMKCIQRRATQYPKAWDFLKRLSMKDEDRQNNAVFARLRPATLLRDSYFAPLLKKPAGAVNAAYAA
jgi:hypothetical protein